MKHDDTTDVSRREFFNDRAEQWLDMWYRDPGTGAPRYEKEFERLFALANLQPGNSVLDLGCGSGVLVPHILRCVGQEGSVHEVDYAERMIEVNRRLHKDPRVTFAACSADAVTVPGEGFDAVLCFACFPHFQDKRKTLAAVREALKPGGSLVVAHFDSSRNINDHHRKHECVMHDRLPAEPEIRQMVADAGMRVTRFIDEPGFYFMGAVKPPRTR